MRPIVYCTREQVKNALDSAEVARNNAQIDRHIRAATMSARKLTLRSFEPVTATRTFDWPPEYETPTSWRLWLGQNEMATAPTAVRVNGVALDLADVLARPDTGPPYDHLELNRASSASWSAGATPQRNVAVDSVYGYTLDELTVADLAADLTSSATLCTLTATTEVGVGSLLRIGTERLNVYGRAWVSTGQSITEPVTADLSSQAVKVANGALFAEGETIQLDSERMRIDVITGNTLTVTRAWDGSTPASHNGALVYAGRQWLVERAAAGTTAAAHTTNDDVWVWQPPSLINQYVIAEAIVTLQQESAGYSMTVGAGDNAREAAGRALNDLRKRVKAGFYRVRKGVV